MRKLLVFMGLVAGLLGCGEVAVTPPETSAAGGASGCAEPLADCDHDGTCETTLGTVEACGACGDVCASSHAAASCVEGACVLTCDAGFTDCNGLASDGCEAQLDIDPRNCGACGNDCGAWSDCLQGTCVEILSSAAAALVGADALVIEGSDLYWSSGGVDADGLIAKVPLAGGPTVTLAPKQTYADCLQSNGSVLVWSDWGALGIYEMPIGGGAVQTLWQPSGGERPHVLAIDADRVYFTTGTDVRTVPVGGGPASVLATGFVDVEGAYLDGANLYITDFGPEIDQTISGSIVSGHPEGSIARIGVASGKVDSIALHLDTPSAVTASGGALYWAESGSMATYYDAADEATNLGTLGRVVRAALDGSQPTVLIDQLVQPVAIAADATHLYVAVAGTAGGTDPADIVYRSDGGLLRVPVAGGPVEAVMPALDVWTVALTDDAVFFSSWLQGVILRKTKP